MDIPETEKLDVNAPSALSDPTILLCLYIFFLFHSFSLSFSYGLGATFDGKPQWSFPPFFGRRKGREKKTISLIFHRAQGHWDNHPVKPMCFPTFEYSVTHSRFKAGAASKVCLDIYRTKTVESRKPHGVPMAFPRG